MSGDAVESTGVTLWEGGTTPCTTAAQYAALTWVKVEEVMDLGEFGRTTEKVTYKTLDGGRVRKKKGTYDSGSPTVQLARIPSGAGQAALRSAAVSKLAHNFKVEFDDAPAAVGSTPTRMYFGAYVMGYTTKVGGPDGVVQATVAMEIDTDVIEVDAHAGP